MSPYCNTVCVPATLSTVPVTIQLYSACASKAVYSSCHHTALQCVCASKSVYSSCQHTALQCVCQQVCLKFLSPYCITVSVPRRLSAVHVTILLYSVCDSNTLQFLSPYCIRMCAPAGLCTVSVTILHYSVCASKVVCRYCHHNALQSLCQQGSL